jgi:hypothetical protein
VAHGRLDPPAETEVHFGAAGTRHWRQGTSTSCSKCSRLHAAQPHHLVAKLRDHLDLSAESLHVLLQRRQEEVVPSDKAALKLASLGRPVKKMIGGVTGWLDEGFTLVEGA